MERATNGRTVPSWADVGFTIPITVGDQRVALVRGYPAAAARGQRMTLLPGSWRSALPAALARDFEQRLASLPGTGSGFSSSKFPILVDARFNEAQASQIVGAISELLQALDAAPRADHDR